MKIKLVHPVKEDVYAPIGFNISCLLIGSFIPLLKGEGKIFVVNIIPNLFLLWFWNLYLALTYNKNFVLRKIADGYLAETGETLPAWLAGKAKIKVSDKSSLMPKPDTEENDIEEIVEEDENEEEENEINMKIPKNYEEDSLQQMFDRNMFNMYEEGWNSNGTPADFVFQDGVKVMYDEVAISDLEEFSVYYKQQIGYRNMSGSAKEIYGESSVDTNSTYLFSFQLDFSARPDLLTCDDEVARVTVTELQLDGATGYIAGNVEIAGCFDQKKLRAWLKNIIETNARVERE